MPIETRRQALSILTVAAASALLAGGTRPATAQSRTPMTTPSGLIITDITVGTGATPRQGQTCVMHYTGWLYDEREPQRRGAEFDSSRPRGEPFEFPLGGGQVIRGWDEGVVGMRIGEVRELAIPSHLAYGSRGAGRVIPPDQALLFEVELLAIDAPR